MIRSLKMPIATEGGTVILTGNLCPTGAVLKQSAALSHPLVRRGRAVVFEDHHDLHRRIDDPDLPVDETPVLVLKQVGPRGVPESAVGGPLALVHDGDEIELDVPRRTLTLRVSDDELARRRAAWAPRPPHFSRGYGRLFLDHVLQANEGCDFDFLRGRTAVRFEDTAGPSHA